MASWEFDKFIKGCPPIKGCLPVMPPGGFGKMYLLPAPPTPSRGKTYWMVGPYKDQTKLATAIRSGVSLQNFLRVHSVRLGLRDSDVAPANVERQKRFGAGVTGANAARIFTPQRSRQDAKPFLSTVPPPDRRVTDELQNKADFWDTQTPQSHHIVESNHLTKLRVREQTGNFLLEHEELPCVLLAAEFHQKYISMILKETHQWGDNRLRAEIDEVYRRLYTQRSLLFRSLWEVSEIILKVSGILV